MHIADFCPPLHADVLDWPVTPGEPGGAYYARMRTRCAVLALKCGFEKRARGVDRATAKAAKEPRKQPAVDMASPLHVGTTLSKLL